MTRCPSILWMLVLLPGFLPGQPRKHPNLADYDEGRKRLLVISTGKFIYANSQGQIDLDSAMLLSCRIYGLGPMIPYDEDFQDPVLARTVRLLDGGDLTSAQAQLNGLKGKDRVPDLLLLASCFLFKAGDEPKDMARAQGYIMEALGIRRANDAVPYQRESDLLAAKYFAKTGNINESQKYFSSAEDRDRIAGDSFRLAKDYLANGDYLPFGHPARIVFLERSMKLFQSLHAMEKQVEALSYIIGVHMFSDWDLSEKELLQLLEIQQQAGFRHVQFTYIVLSYLYEGERKTLKALAFTEKCLKTMRETGDDYLIAVPYQLMGEIYHGMGRSDEAFNYFRRAYGPKDPNTMIFWDKSFTTATFILASSHREKEALGLIKEITTACPPVTLFDKMHVAYLTGYCYDGLQDTVLAEKYYDQFISMAGTFPREHTHGETPAAYFTISKYYFRRGNLGKAKLYLQKAREIAVPSAMTIENLTSFYFMQFTIDSSEHRFGAAIEDHIQFKFYDDSLHSLGQIQHMDDLVVKYETQRKDNSIQLLTKEASLQNAEIRRSATIRNVTIGASALLLIIATLTYSLYRNKKRTSEEIARKNASLEELVREKEWLVQEIHHRVKNNLHTVIGLLESQSVYLQNDALQAIRDSQHRIFAMSLIHQKLYQSDDLKTIDMPNYLSELIIYLRESFEARNNILFDVNIEPVELDVSQAVPAGLILNEALTNSLKYAFPYGQKGMIRVCMTADPGTEKIDLVIEDNGIGFPTHLTPSNTGSLGMKLMKGLSKEIHAAFDITSTGAGTRIRIQFNQNRYYKAKNVLHMNKKVLIVEDQFIEANYLQVILEKGGYTVCTIAQSVTEAMAILSKEGPDIVLIDIFLQGDRTGIDLARELRKKNVAFIYISANSNKETLEAAKKTQPYGFLVKPFREKDILVMLSIARYRHQQEIESNLQKAKAAAGDPRALKTDFSDIIGHDKTLKEVLEHIRIVAPTETSVIILGESGTGKERIAGYVHELSQRKSKPFIKVNCAALPSTLIESELFGHEKGAFTGAYEKRIGKFEQAAGGTVFLDEIGEIPLETQVKLLRVLQEKEIQRVGGQQTIKTDVRIISATNRNLETAVAEGRFRIDLYYRLLVFPVVLPPLRERKSDIPLLAAHFVGKYARQYNRPVAGISPKALETIMMHHWPGNIRELEHLMERSVLLCKESMISAIPLAAPVDPPVALLADNGKMKTIEENEKDYIVSALAKTQGKIFGPGGAAEMLGINPTTLHSKLKKFGIDKKQFVNE